MIPASLSVPVTSVKTLNGTNFEDWKESLEFYLALTNFDLALRENEPAAITPTSTAEQKTYHDKWMHSNRVCLQAMNFTMGKSIRQSIPTTEKAKDFLKLVGEKFKTFDKAQKGQYLSLLEKTKYDGVSGVSEHMMKLLNYFNKLKSLKVELGDNFLIRQILESLPSQFDVLKTSYNTQKHEWTVDEMIAIVSQEEESMKKTKSHGVQLAASSFGFKHKKKSFTSQPHLEKEQNGKAPVALEPKKYFFNGNCRF